MKVDIGRDTCVITTGDLKKLNMPAKLMPSNSIHTNFHGRTRHHHEKLKLKITHRKKQWLVTSKLSMLQKHSYSLAANRNLSWESFPLAK